MSNQNKNMNRMQETVQQSIDKRKKENQQNIKLIIDMLEKGDEEISYDIVDSLYNTVSKNARILENIVKLVAQTALDEKHRLEKEQTPEIKELRHKTMNRIHKKIDRIQRKKDKNWYALDKLYEESSGSRRDIIIYLMYQQAKAEVAKEIKKEHGSKRNELIKKRKDIIKKEKQQKRKISKRKMPKREIRKIKAELKIKRKEFKENEDKIVEEMDQKLKQEMEIKQQIKNKYERERRGGVILNEAEKIGKMQSDYNQYWVATMEDFEKDPPNLEPYLLKVPNKIEQEKWNRMSKNEKGRYFKKLLKTMAISYAREIKYQNLTKWAEMKSYDKYKRSYNKAMYMKKDWAVESFLRWAKIYNYFVPKEQQIYYGLEKDMKQRKKDNEKKERIAIDINIPGDDRAMSAHVVIIDDENLQEMQKEKIYKYVGEYPETTEQFLEEWPYKLKFETRNTGMPSNHREKQALLESAQFANMVIDRNGHVNEKMLDFYVNFYHADYNDSKIIYFANKMELGRDVLMKLNNLLTQREEGQEVEERRKQYYEKNKDKMKEILFQKDGVLREYNIYNEARQMGYDINWHKNPFENKKENNEERY